MRKAGRPGGRKALQAPGKRRAQEQVKNVGREYKTSAFLNTYQKPYEVALTHKDMDALKPANGSRMLTKNIKLPSTPNFPPPLYSSADAFSSLVQPIAQNPDQYLLDLPELQGRDRPTFENFVVGSNSEAAAALARMAADEGPKFLYLYGLRGAGLSHLLEAYLPGTAAALYPVPIYQPGVKRYAVDDIDALDEGYARQLLQLQNAVYVDPDARLVCAGRLPPKELKLPAGVINRLLGGLCYAVEPLNEEDRIRELARQAALRGILLTPDIGQWISAHLPRDMRSLTRVMDVANQIALHAQRKVTLQVIREAARAAGMAEDEGTAQQGEAPTALLGTGH